MARGKQFEISGNTYNTASLENEVKRIKERLAYGEQITRGDTDFEFMAELYNKYYPRYEGDKKPKSSDSVMDLTVQPNEKCDFRSHTFFWVMPDGELINWQPKDCFKPKNQKAEAKEGFRWAIKPQTHLKLQMVCSLLGGRPMECPITGKMFYPNVTGQAEVHHLDPSFNEILNRFIEENGIDIESVKIVTRKDDRYGKFLVDTELEKKFQAYHAQHANLQVVSKEGHKAVTYKKKELSK